MCVVVRVVVAVTADLRLADGHGVPGVAGVPRELDPGDVGRDGRADVTPAGVCVGPAVGSNAD
jgi:hypothetical protein